MGSEERRVPEDPLEFIRGCVRAGRVLWTYHVQMRLRGRGISRNKVLDSVGTYEVLEQYPDDKYLPSFLVYCRHGEDVLHILFATDVGGDNVRIVTAYHPTPEDWEADLKKRRRHP